MESSLETRTCACGCGKQWKCLPTSKWKYSSLHCAIASGDGESVKFRSQHWEYNGAAIVAEKQTHSEINTKRGKKCRPNKHSRL